jgi:hypothetical protein
VRGFRTTALLFLCSLALGCTSASVSRDSKVVMPVTYTVLEGTRMERSVGKLRRLAVLPVQLKVTPKSHKWCLVKCGWGGLDNSIEMEAINCLRDKRGYEVISLDSPANESAVSFTPEELSRFAKTLADNARAGNPDQPQEEVVTLVKELSGRAGLDGIVVIQGKATSMSLIDWAAGYASFSLSLPLSFVRIGVSLRADVFETATGRNVWTCTLYGGGEPSADEHYGMVLLDPIEPAIPRALTRPPETNTNGDNGVAH